MALTRLASANLKLSKRERLSADRVDGEEFGRRRTCGKRGHIAVKAIGLRPWKGYIGDGSVVASCPRELLRLELQALSG